MKITTITESDLENAIHVAKTQSPCVGSLIERTNEKASRCVLGCIIQGVARSRHKSFDDVMDAFQENAPESISPVESGIVKALRASGFDADLNSTMEVNDKFKNLGLLKAWQVRRLEKILNSKKTD